MSPRAPVTPVGFLVVCSVCLRLAGRRLLTAVPPLVLTVSISLAAVPPAQATQGRIVVRGEQFLDAAGMSVFLLGVNYEGPADRAWQMWDDGKYDPRLIAADLDRAKGAGALVLRVFVQQSLANDIAVGRWQKLDEFLRLVEDRGLRIILTFADYPERSLANLTAIDRQVASRYAGRPGIFAYDLKNEPRFGDLALAQYLPGSSVPLQSRDLIPLIGEWVPRAGIDGYRRSEEGQSRIPTYLSDDQAYVYANLLAAYLQFLDEASAWAVQNNSTTVRYTLSAASQRWEALKDALNDTLALWVRQRLDAIRAADPNALVTIGHVDPVLASLPANNLLDYRTLHRYVSASSAGVRLGVALFNDVRAAVPGKPLVLGEFGFSNSDVPEDRSAALEAEFVRGVHQVRAAGALKWMLNDFPLGFNPYQNQLGMFRGDGSPKPIVAAFRELAFTLDALTLPLPARDPDYALPNGRFFTQSSGRPADQDASGFSVTNADGVPFWDTWQALGVENIGYPISRRFYWRGFLSQVFQKGILQYRPGEGVGLVNLLDELSAAGLDSWLRAQALVPPPRNPALDTAQSWDELVRQRQALLDANEAIRSRYLRAPDPLFLYGLPTSEVVDLGDVVALRTQRAVFQQWKTDVPWAAAGEVTVANSGDLAKRLDLFPAGALVPEPAPFLEEPAPLIAAGS